MACAVGALLVSLALVVAPSGPTGAADAVRYVAPWGDDGASGSAAAPYRTLRHAVRVASDGDMIVLRAGRYHDSVQLYAKRLTIASAPGERAVLDGAVRVTGWRPDGGDWVVDGWTAEFAIESGGPIAVGRPEAGYPDQVWVDDRPLRQVLARAAVVPGTFFVDRGADRLWIGDDPSGHVVEASTLPWALYFNGADGSRLRNVTVRRYATQSWEMAAVRGYADDLVLEGVVVEDNARIGLSLMGERLVVRSGAAVDNGHLGIHVHQSADVVIEEVAVLGNNKAGFDPFHSAGGIKITSSSRFTVRSNDVSHNDGVGIWTDLGATSGTISRNLAERNGRSGIEIELSSRINVVGNVAMGNGEAGVWVLESSDVQVFHNALYSNITEISVLDGPRHDVHDIRIRNNVLGAGRPGANALMSIEDWTSQRSASDMRVSSDYNAYWLPPSADIGLLDWDDQPGQLRRAETLKALRREADQAHNSVLSTSLENPFVRDPAAGDYRAPGTMPLGEAVTGGMAAALDAAPGTRLPIGPQLPVVRRGGTDVDPWRAAQVVRNAE